MGGPNKRYVPELEVLESMTDEEIWNRFKKVEIFIGSSDSIKYVNKVLNQYYEKNEKGIH